MAAFEWGGFLTLAQTLGAQADDAALRTSISRAYYYVYHLARLRAEVGGFTLKDQEGGSHKQLWTFYQNSVDGMCQMLYVVGDRMRTRRVRADYRTEYLRLTDDVTRMLEEAQNFAQMLARIDPRHPNESSQRQQFRA